MFLPGRINFFQYLMPALRVVLGPDVISASRLEEVYRTIYHPDTGGLLIVLWANASRSSFERIAHVNQHHHMRFMDVTNITDAHEAEREQLNPNASHVLAYLWRSRDGSHETFASNDTTYEGLHSFVKTITKMRHTHEYDDHRQFDVLDMFTPEECVRRAHFGDDVELGIVGYVIVPGGAAHHIMFLHNHTLTPCEIGHDTHVVEGIQRAAEGMCSGMWRRVVIPPEYGYGRQGLPPYVSGNAMLLVYVSMHRIATPGDEL